MEWLPIKRALVSVTDKNGLVEFAKFLTGNNVEITSTGGTQKLLENENIPVAPVSEVTKFPEMLDGRVKTLHPKIHAGILADKDKPDHLKALAETDIRPYDLVVVNLYNFEGALRDHLDEAAMVERIDIGGPCLMRAAAKNFSSVLVLPAPHWYAPAMELLRTNQMRIPLAFRKAMAREVFAATAAYDSMIDSWFCKVTRWTME